MTTLNKQIDAKIFDMVYEWAVEDAVAFGRFSGFAETIMKNKALKRTIKNYIDKVLGSEATEASFWETVSLCKNISEEKVFHGFVLDFWHIQTLINKTVGYMYIMSYKNQNTRKRFALFHCPLESTIVDEVIKELQVFDLESAKKETKERVTFYLSKECLKLLNKPITKIDFSDTAQYDLFQEIVLFLSSQKNLNPIDYYYLMRKV